MFDAWWRRRPAPPRSPRPSDLLQRLRFRWSPSIPPRLLSPSDRLAQSRPCRRPPRDWSGRDAAVRVLGGGAGLVLGRAPHLSLVVALLRPVARCSQVSASSLRRRAPVSVLRPMFGPADG